MKFTYDGEARSRIAGFGNLEILAFLEQVPDKIRKQVFGALKPVPAFRPDEPTELKERIKKLAKNLSHAINGSQKANERDWTTLGWVWAGWLRTKYKNAVDLPLERLENEKLSFETFLKAVLSNDEEEKLAQEDISEIYKFSPFSSIVAESELIRSLPTRVELGKQHEARELKTRLATLERKTETIADTLAATTHNSTSATAEQVIKMQSELNRLSDEFLKFVKRSQVSEEQGISRNNLLGKALDTLTHSSDGIFRQLHSYESRVSALDKSNVEFIGAVKRIEGMVKVLQKSMAEHDKDRISSKEPVALASSALVPAVHIEHQRSPNGVQVAALDTLRKLHSALSYNYRAIGLGEKSSEKLALTVAAAISSGQFVQFVGALADLIADATLSSVAGGATVAWDVPSGLFDGSAVSSVMREMSKDSKTSTGLILRGFNKSAFDIYGYELKKILVSRFFGLVKDATKPIVVATALKSDSYLPLTTSTAELGPIIDTALLTWVRPKGEIIFGRMGAIEYASELDEQSDTILTDLSNQIADMPIAKSELWRRNIRYAKAKLAQFVDEKNEIDIEAVESLLTSWVLPWISLQSNGSDEATAFIREHIQVVDVNEALKIAVEKYLAAAA